MTECLQLYIMVKSTNQSYIPMTINIREYKSPLDIYDIFNLLYSFTPIDPHHTLRVLGTH